MGLLSASQSRMELARRHSAVIAVGAGVAIGVVIWAKRKRWVKVGHVESLYVFPLKSGAPIESDSLKFESMGPKLDEMIDRGFAVANAGTYTVKDTHSFPRLCLMSTNKVKNENGFPIVTLQSPDAAEDLVFQLPKDFSLEPPSSFASTSIIGGQCSSVFDCGEEAAGWLSRVLKKQESGLRLIYHYKEVSVRTHSPQYVRPFGDTMGPTYLPALSNAAPYHLVTDSSVFDLNRQMQNNRDECVALNFRPNLVVKTLSEDPYQEDRWKQVRIGNVELEFSLPDNRCLTVNYNQRTAEKDDRILKWLKTNRRTLNKKTEHKLGGPAGIFGHRYGLKQGTEGEVKKGQEVWAYISRF